MIERKRHDSCDEVLRAEWQPGQEIVEPVERPPGCEQQVLGSNQRQTSLRQSVHDLAARQQMNTRVERCRMHHSARQRIPRVVLEDSDKPTGTGDTRHLREQRTPTGELDVMENADCEREIEGIVQVRESLAVVGLERRLGHAGTSADKHFLRDVDAVKVIDPADEMSRDEACAAADIERSPPGTERAGGERDQPMRLCFDVTFVRLSRERDRLLDLSLVGGRVTVEAHSGTIERREGSTPAASPKPLRSRTTYSGLALTSSKMRPTYTPIIPITIN